MVGTQGVRGTGRAESVGSEHRKGRGQTGWGNGDGIIAVGGSSEIREERV